MICPACNGIGTAYYAIYIPRNTTVQVTGATYQALPCSLKEATRKNSHYHKKKVFTCEYCEGTGEVREEY